MKNIRIALHWWLQERADWLWDRRFLMAGNICCKVASAIYPAECKADPTQWNGHIEQAAAGNKLTGFEAKFLSQRLGRVCRRLGFNLPLDTDEGNAEVAGTTLARVDREISTIIQQRDGLLKAMESIYAETSLGLNCSQSNIRKTAKQAIAAVRGGL